MGTTIWSHTRRYSWSQPWGKHPGLHTTTDPPESLGRYTCGGHWALAPGTGSGTGFIGFIELPGTGNLALAQPLVTYSLWHLWPFLIVAHWPMAPLAFSYCGTLAFILWHLWPYRGTLAFLFI